LLLPHFLSSLRDNEEHVVPLDVKAPAGASTDDRIVNVRVMQFSHQLICVPFKSTFSCACANPPSLTPLQERVPLGVDLRTAPLHGADKVLSDAEFGHPDKINLPGIHMKFSGISDIFADTRVDSKHKHYP
jgi:hypothetical protein